MDADNQEVLTRHRRFVLPLIVMALICSIAQVIFRPTNPFLIIAYVIFMLGALIAALAARKASAKMWAVTFGAIILAAIAGGVVGFLLK